MGDVIGTSPEIPGGPLVKFQARPPHLSVVRCFFVAFFLSLSLGFIQVSLMRRPSFLGAI
jgi:hypothetical protein